MDKRLSLEQTFNCLKLWREFGDMNAQTLLVVSNMALVNYIVKKYMNKGISFEELQSAGNEGLVKAINMFDYINQPIEGFSKYIFIAIENSIKNEIRSYNKNNRDLSFNAPITYNKYGTDYTFEEMIGTDIDELLNEVASKIEINLVRQSLQTLTPLEFEIIFLRYGFNSKCRKSFTEIAQILGKSRHVISIQEKKALIKLRKFNNLAE